MSLDIIVFRDLAERCKAATGPEPGVGLRD